MDCLAIELKTPIVNDRGENVGYLDLEIIPVSPDGEEVHPSHGNADDDKSFLFPYQEPENEDWMQLGTRVDFRVGIHAAQGLNKGHAAEAYCRYQFFMDEEFTETARYSGKVRLTPVIPLFHYLVFSQVHHPSGISWQRSPCHPLPTCFCGISNGMN